MRPLTLSVLMTFALGAGACSDKAPCAKLAERLCEGASDRCLEAKSWVDAQSAGDDICQRVLDDGNAVASYRDRFLADMTATSEPEPAYGAPPTRKPTTREKIRNVGETLEEVGNTGQKAGEAIDKLQGAIDRAQK